MKKFYRHLQKKSILLLVAATSLPIWGADFYVDLENGDPRNDGLSWENAVLYVNDALMLASFTPDGDTIHVTAGWYDAGMWAPHWISSEITLLGGYPPGGGVRDLGANRTILESSGLGSSFIIQSTESVIIDGFEIVRGGGDYTSYCGGIRVIDSPSVTIRNVVFRENYLMGDCIAWCTSPGYDCRDADCDDPCVECYPCPNNSGEVTEKCEIIESVPTKGGALYGESSNIDIINCLYVDNFVSFYFYSECIYACEKEKVADGSAIYLAECDGRIKNVTITSNRYYWYAVTLKDCATEVTNSIIWGNVELDYDGPNASYSNIGNGNIIGAGNTSGDPLFVSGPLGDYYLSHIAAGQPDNSPCIDGGGNPASQDGLDQFTTRCDEVEDAGTVDMGYHYPITNLEPQLIIRMAGDDITYDPPGLVKQDLIRGLLDDVVEWPDIIDLREVTCVAEDDDTGRINDSTLPDQGEVFFYLLQSDTRGGDYGKSSSGKERVPLNGCS